MARAVLICEQRARLMREQCRQLNEAQKRQYLGREALALGRGGPAAVARAAHVDPRTVTRGMSEVEEGDVWVPGDRVRSPGAGRPSAERSFAEATGGDLRATVSAIVDASSYGDPCVETRLAHTSATAWKVAAEIERAHGFRMCETTCRRVIYSCEYTLQRNRKAEQTSEPSPMQDEQFRRKDEAVADFEARGLPIVSCDAKAKVKPGPFAAGGRELRRKGDARVADDHDFACDWGEIYPDGHPELDEARMDEAAVLTPYGVYDVGTNTAHVTLGTSRDTSGFAAGGFGRWWDARGRHDHPGATEVLVLVDGGGSNRAAGFLYKLELARECARVGLEAVTVLHFPPGTSRYNPVERKLWSPLSRSWAGKPIEDVESACAYISATTTRKGLEVSCEVDWGVHLTEAAKERARKEAGDPKGPSAEGLLREIADIEYFHEDPTMRKWNYRIVLKKRGE